MTPLGKGVCNVVEAYNALVELGYDGYSTLEIAGKESVLESYEFLKSMGAE